MRIHAGMRAARSTELHPAAPTWLSIWLSDQASFVYPVPNQIFGGLSDSAGDPVRPQGIEQRFRAKCPKDHSAAVRTC